MQCSWSIGRAAMATAPEEASERTARRGSGVENITVDPNVAKREFERIILWNRNGFAMNEQCASAKLSVGRELTPTMLQQFSFI